MRIWITFINFGCQMLDRVDWNDVMFQIKCSKVPIQKKLYTATNQDIGPLYHLHGEAFSYVIMTRHESLCNVKGTTAWKAISSRPHEGPFKDISKTSRTSHDNMITRDLRAVLNYSGRRQPLTQPKTKTQSGIVVASTWREFLLWECLVYFDGITFMLKFGPRQHLQKI